MQHASNTRRVHASPEAVWALVADVTTIDRYHPSVKSADLLSPAATGVGATRRCNFHDGSDVREEVVEMEEGRRVKLALSEFSLPMKRIEAEFQVAPADDGLADVTFTVSYEVKYGPLGRLLGATVVRKQLRAMTARVVAGLDHHLRTGERVGQDFVEGAD
jgi:ribosome-associated toxin RatA of RatAB toxin-antitoxin module